MKKAIFPAVAFIANCLLPAAYSFSQGAWTQKADFGGTRRAGASGFSIGGKGYIGTGYNPFTGHRNDFWEYDPCLDTWTQKADFPGGGVQYAVGFSIGGKGYIGTGEPGSGGYTNTFYEWNQSTNTWIKKADFAGAARKNAVGFSIGTKGYIGTGRQNAATKYQDLWEYDPVSDTWTQKANFSGTARYSAAGFSIGAKGYIGTGTDAVIGNTRDFWEYNPVSDIWTKKADFGGVSRFQGTGLSLGSKGYMGMGWGPNSSCCELRDFWEYDPSLDTWTRKTDFQGTARSFVVSFSIDCKCYIGTGSDGLTPSNQADFWEWYDSSNSIPCASCGALNINVTSVNINCNGQCTGRGAAAPSGGTAPYTYNWLPSGGTDSIATGLCAGTYSVTVTDSVGSSATATVTITQSAALTATITSIPPGCSNNNGTATATVNGGTSPYTYIWCNGQTASTATGLAAGSCTVIVMDANGCAQNATATIFPGNTFSINVTSTPTGCSTNTGTAAAFPNGGTSPYTYLWNNNSTNQQINNLSAGAYTVTVTDVNGCAQAQTVTVTSTGGPTAIVTATITTLTPGDSTTLIASGGGTYSWYPSTGLSCTACSNPTATASPLWGTGGLVYCVTVTDANNCTDSACITIYVEIPCGNIFVPNAFSPNSDGHNELECVLGNCIQTMHFAIYTRWGEKVFETIDITRCWDGTYRGTPLNTAVFVYYMEATLTNGEKIMKNGNVSLIR